MSYLGRMVAKSRRGPSRIAARTLPTFDSVETHLEENTDEVLLPTPAAVAAAPFAPVPRTTEAPDASSREVLPLRTARVDMTDLEPSRAEVVPAREPSVEEPKQHTRRIRRETRVLTRRQHETKRSNDDSLLPAPDAPLLLATDGDFERTHHKAGLRPAPMRALTNAQPRGANHSELPREVSTTVNVAIGRIEVRATIPAESPKEPRARPFRPRLSLEEYLARNGNGAR